MSERVYCQIKTWGGSIWLTWESTPNQSQPELGYEKFTAAEMHSECCSRFEAQPSGVAVGSLSSWSPTDTETPLTIIIFPDHQGVPQCLWSWVHTRPHQKPVDINLHTHFSRWLTCVKKNTWTVCQLIFFFVSNRYLRNWVATRYILNFVMLCNPFRAGVLCLYLSFEPINKQRKVICAVMEALLQLIARNSEQSCTHVRTSFQK